MDGNGRSAASQQKKPLVADTDLVELLWHNGGVVAQPQTHPRTAPAPAANPACASGLTGEETAAWFGDVDGLESEMYAQLWSSIADGPPAALPGPPPHHQAAPRPPMRSGIASSWTGGGGDIGSTFCGSSQVPEPPAGVREEGSAAALPSEGTRGTSTRDGTGTYTGTGTGTSSSGGSGSNFGGSGLPSESDHAHKRKGRGRDQSEDAEYEATEETKSSRRHGSKRRTRAAEVHNLSERRRRDRINEKMRSLQELVPHCNKLGKKIQADKASILDEAIEYLKSLQMQVQIMWMTTGMAPMMFPGAHQFMPPMAVGMNSACLPSAQGLNQMARLPYMNHSLSNHIPMNQSAAMNPMYVANQMQNIHLREAGNHFLHSDGGQTAAPQVAGLYAYAPQNHIPEVPDSTVVPTSGPGQPPTSDGI